MESKTCTKCHVVKPLDQFHAHKNSAGGIHSQCKDCGNVYNRQWREENRMRARTLSRRNYWAGKEGQLPTRTVPPTKVCRDCGIEKPADSFHSEPRNRDGLISYCKPCRTRRSTEQSRTRRFTTYGLSPEEFQDQFDRQNGACAICQQPCSTGRVLSIDHDHDTGQPRGLLCSNCNNGLGRFQDEPALVAAAAQYLSIWKGK